jgi:MFS transporter, MFS domain-containing protein family, molybdate-anion transporter
MINEHFSKNFSSTWLDNTFYLQSFGNGIIAIISGILGAFVKNYFDSCIYYNNIKKVVAPFDLAAFVLIVGGGLIFYFWEENFGNEKNDVGTNFSESFQVIKSDIKIITLGISQSFFEASMYTFGKK